jgi:hypothetical protein
MKHLLTACLIMSSLAAAKAEEPPWMRGELPTQSNETYYFKVAFGEGETPAVARTGAIIALVNELARNQGVTIKGSDIIKSIIQQNNDNYTEQNIALSTYKIETDRFNAKFEIADIYIQANICWILFEVAKNPKRRTAFDKIEYTTDYKASALWRSALAPGWGQIHKKNTAKGITILTLELTGIAGALIFNDLSNSYANKAVAETDMHTREAYADKSASFRNIRNGLFFTAGAIYLFNLVDAISAKGARRYKATASANSLALAILL